MAIKTPSKDTAPSRAPGDPGPRHGAFRLFWENTGETLPAFSDAPSTLYYAECERYLFEHFFPALEGRSLFKTDLWDEAKNTRILYWAAAQKRVVPFGLDISAPIVRQAKDWFVEGGAAPRFVVADIRSAAFRDDSFDLIYSMGTVEHFPDYRRGLEECFRVLKPGGTAIIGVPNKLDPFLRPLLVALLNQLDLYDYGYEKSFTPGRFRRLLEDVGFTVVARTGILFIPGWLRLLDLFLFVRDPRWSAALRPFVAPFAWLYRHSSLARSSGYLLAAVVRKP